MMSDNSILTEPFLQLPTINSVRVIWFTNCIGSDFYVNYGANLEGIARAKSLSLSRLRENRDFQLETIDNKPTIKEVFTILARKRLLRI
jgi:hypothetical protein